MKIKLAIVVLALALLLTFSSACIVITTPAPNYYGTSNLTGVPTYYTTVAPKTTLSITKNQLSKDAAGNVIGLVSIKNIGSNTQDIASVTGKFFDSSNNLIYSSTDTILNLAPGATWDYTFTCNSANANKVTTFTVDVNYN
ncbi:MAG: FxLYD domain-containing protein [Dehalococcoidales bacterium]